MALSTRFSDNTAPFIVDCADLMTTDTIDDEPPRIRPLVRQTNEWTGYFGDYPAACAEIMNGNIQDHVGRTGKYITRHVLQLPINSNSLLLSPTNREIGAIQRDVQSKIEIIYMQLEVFADNGLITLRKTKGGAEIVFQGETVFIHFKLCQETSMLHTLISKRPKLIRELIYPEMDNISSLIYCLRMIFVTPGIFVSFDFELNYEDIEQASVMTFELSIVPPTEEPEWLHDDLPDGISNDWP
jgi:hypothetical protein